MERDTLTYSQAKLIEVCLDLDQAQLDSVLRYAEKILAGPLEEAQKEVKQA